MKAKIASIITIASVILIAIIVSLYIVLSGMKNGGYNYVLIESTSKIEFVTDTKDKVVGYKALNDEARLVVSNLEIEGLEIDEAIDKILTNNLKMGYLKISDNEEDYNIIKLTVVPGLTQALDVHVFKAVNKFLVKNEVLAVIVENSNDMESIKEGKEINTSPHKLALIKSCINSNSALTKESLKHKKEDELIDLIMNFDDNYNAKYPTTIDEIEEQKRLMNENTTNYEEHISKINKKEAGKFVKKLQDLTKKEQTKLELNYSKYINTED